MKILLFLSFNALLLNVTGQGFKDNLYQSWGFTYFLDVSVSQVKSFTFDDYTPDENGDLEERRYKAYSQTKGISVITGIYRIRYNVFNFEESAISLSMTPALGLSQVDLDAYSDDNTAIKDPDRVGIGQFNLPIFLGYESGLGSKRALDSPWGWLVKLGYEYNISPLVYYNKAVSPYLNGAWGQPSLVCAYRYKNKKDALREINLKVGHIPLNNSPTEFAEDKVLPPLTFRVSFMRQIN